MGAYYKIEYFKYEDGTNPIEYFLDHDVDTHQKAIILSNLERLRNVGLQLLQTKAAKPFNIKKQLYELTKGDFRVVFFARGNTFHVLHAFPKHSDKTLLQDKAIIEQRLGILIKGEKK